jgi:hypothetical protein
MVSVTVMLLPWAILLEETQCKLLLPYFLPLKYLICFFSALAGISYPKLFNSLILVEPTLYPVSNSGLKLKPAIFMRTIGRRSSWPSKSVRTRKMVSELTNILYPQRRSKEKLFEASSVPEVRPSSPRCTPRVWVL